MTAATAPVALGVSACLLGHQVRYNGQHRRDSFLSDTLAQSVALVPVCPEVECGLEVPREPIELRGDPGAPCLVTVRTGGDLTARMQRWAGTRLSELSRTQLCGFVFKSASPSCGIQGVTVHGPPDRSGTGIFARAFMDRFPLLPVADETHLQDPSVREHFLVRLFTYGRWQDLVAGPHRRGRLVEFHSRHKMLLMAHSPVHYRRMGRLVAQTSDIHCDELFERYGQGLMGALRLKTTRRKNTDVLQHMAGFFKQVLDPAAKQQLTTLIERYRTGEVPLIEPVSLISSHAHAFDQRWLTTQYYLEPCPPGLVLRSHA